MYSITQNKRCLCWETWMLFSSVLVFLPLLSSHVLFSSAWLGEDDHPVISQLTRRMADVSGLNMQTAVCNAMLQVLMCMSVVISLPETNGCACIARIEKLDWNGFSILWVVGISYYLSNYLTYCNIQHVYNILWVRNPRSTWCKMS